MNEDLLLETMKKVAELEKRIENYFQLLRIENELDFIMNGTYILNRDINDIMTGNY